MKEKKRNENKRKNCSVVFFLSYFFFSFRFSLLTFFFGCFLLFLPHVSSISIFCLFLLSLIFFTSIFCFILSFFIFSFTPFSPSSLLFFPQPYTSSFFPYLFYAPLILLPASYFYFSVISPAHLLYFHSFLLSTVMLLHFYFSFVSRFCHSCIRDSISSCILFSLPAYFPFFLFLCSSRIHTS